MNDTLREYLSYGSIVVPLLKVRKIIKPTKVQWGNKDQYFLHYKSPSPVNDTLVIYIHGGGWNSGSPANFHFIGQRIALEGYDCIMPGYRKSPKHHYEDIVHDVFNGFAEIGNYADENKLSYSKIVIMGSSAGAHLGALLCCDKEMQIKYGIDCDRLSGLISLAGPLCFDEPRTFELSKLTGDMFGSNNRTDWEKGEPVRKLSCNNNTRMLIVQSRHDGIVGYEQAVKFVNSANEMGISAELYEVTEKRNTHSLYSAGIFLWERSMSPLLDKVFNWIESI
ncbi:MAG: alpha/beta hydrolase fold domain-containing protein [Ruminiclostridium sp.]|nr:alpha/beta hydrolase fold domain-containing protein [Ruminiclostridium sp.]